MGEAVAAFQHIKISELHEHPQNPRRHFDEADLAQLTESIRTSGMIVPLTVRRLPSGYQILAGHRRYRAAKKAGLAEVPAIVREIDDGHALELMIVDNLQRSDVHPLDEAKGYEALMAAPYKMPVEKIAERVGRSVKYVYDRVKLLVLCPEAQQLFWDGKIEAGHAILLARLTSAEQAKVIGDKEANYQNGGLLVHENALFAGDELDGDDEHGPVKAVSVRELDKYIKRHVRFHATAPDCFLFPDTAEKVAQATQGKIKVIEITREYLADDAVRKDGGGKIYGERAWKRADGKDGSRTCDRSVMGVVVCGPGQGEAFYVCINKEKCEVHWGREIKEREKRRKALAAGGETAQKAKQSEAESYRKQQERWEREHQEKQARANRWNAARPRIVAAIVERVKALPVKPTGLLADVVVGGLHHRGYNVNKLARGKSLEDFLRSLAQAILVGKATSWDAAEEFPNTAKALGLDLDKLLPPEKPEKPAAAASAKKPEKGKKRKAA